MILITIVVSFFSVNAWIIYQQNTIARKPVKRLAFQTAIIEGLIGGYRSEARVGR